MQKTLRIKNDIHELSMMNQFLEEAGEELGLSTAFMMSLNLVMEEAVSNIIFYAYKGDVEDAVDISLVREGGELIVTLIDHGIAFDPTLRKDPDIASEPFLAKLYSLYKTQKTIATIFLQIYLQIQLY